VGRCRLVAFKASPPGAPRRLGRRLGSANSRCVGWHRCVREQDVSRECAAKTIADHRRCYSHCYSRSKPRALRCEQSRLLFLRTSLRALPQVRGMMLDWLTSAGGVWQWMPAPVSLPAEGDPSIYPRTVSLGTRLNLARGDGQRALKSRNVGGLRIPGFFVVLC
jgi:hypothetical protein